MHPPKPSASNVAFALNAAAQACQALADSIREGRITARDHVVTAETAIHLAEALLIAVWDEGEKSSEAREELRAKLGTAATEIVGIARSYADPAHYGAVLTAQPPVAGAA